MSRKNGPTTLVLMTAALGLPGTQTAAQSEPPTLVLDQVDRMDFNRPESWALKYFASVSMMTGMGPPRRTDFGAIDIGVEVGWIPTLSEDQRRVGFVGNKVEDLNRNSAYGRVRASFGLPHGFSVIVAYSPPIPINGVEGQLLNLAVARPVYDSPSWLLGLRLYGQKGDIAGDFTCPSDIAGMDDPSVNPEDCHQASDDHVRLDYVGLEFTAAPTIQAERWQPYLAASANYMDLAFQVDALYSIFLDRSLLTTAGWSYSVAAGVEYRWTRKLGLVGELYYSPLDVVRDPAATTTNDGLFDARFLLSWALR